MEIIKLMALRQIQNSYEKCREVVEQSIKMVTKKQNKTRREERYKTVNENKEKLKKRTEPINRY